MKPPYLLKLTFLFLIGMSFHSINSKAQETRNVNVSNFSAVQVSTGIQLYLNAGNTESAKIVADDGVIGEVEVTSADNKLTVKFRENHSLTNKWKNKNAKVYVSYKSLNDVAASSGSAVISENTLKSDHLNLKASSGADIKLTVACKDLQIQASSGAGITLKGTAANSEIKSSSGSDVRAAELSTDYANIKASSGGSVKLRVNKGLETASSSGGSIRYSGNASLKDSSSSRTGDVKKVD